MSTRGISRNFFFIGQFAAAVVLMASTAWAQSPQPLPKPGDPAPVQPKGLFVEYYNDTVALGSGCPAPPGSVLTPTSTTATRVAVQLEGPIDSAVVAPGRPAAVNDDNIYARFSGFITTVGAGDYVIAIRIDDGGRLWFNQNPLTTTRDIDSWIGQGPTTYSKTFTGLTAATRYPVTFEWFEGAVTQYAGLLWTPPMGTSAAVPLANLTPPDGPAAPTLVATSPIAPPPPLVNLSWNVVAGAQGYIISRSTTSAPAVPMQVLTLINSGTTNAYVDTTAAFGATYQYIIQSTREGHCIVGPASAPQTVSPILPAITISPQTGLQTNENGAQAVATITFNQQLPAGQSVTLNVTVNPPTEATASALGQTTTIANGNMTLVIPGLVNAGATISLTLTGADDKIVDPATPYTVSFTTSGFFGAVTIPPLNCVNNDNDSPGMTISRTSGLVTSESGGIATFTVVLNTRPSAPVNMTLTSSNPAEGTVSPGSLQFTATDGQNYTAGTGVGGWDVAHLVTVTGVDDALLDFAQPYTIITGPVTSADPNYNFTAPDISCLNLDNEIPPALPEVWGNGCGLLGLELGLPLLFALALRRRRNT